MRFEISSTTDAVKRSMGFDQAMRHETENEATALAAMAHLVIETDSLSEVEVTDLVCSEMKWRV
ncbi:MAG: hypothetical protein R2706_07110 [Acidimicrobiales bacterium]